MGVYPHTDAKAILLLCFGKSGKLRYVEHYFALMAEEQSKYIQKFDLFRLFQADNKQLYKSQDIGNKLKCSKFNLHYGLRYYRPTLTHNIGGSLITQTLVEKGSEREKQ